VFGSRQRPKQYWGLPKRLSLDEFARRKGKGQFATILTDLDKSSLWRLTRSIPLLTLNVLLKIHF
jgi:transposase